jgi:hypothetical protein
VKLPEIKDFIEYNKNVGPLQMVYIGYPGSGKSNHVTSLNLRCIGDRREMGLTHGDLSCEWRHFTRYREKKKLSLKVLIPEDIKGKVFYEGSPDFGPDTWIPVDYNKFNIVDHLEPGQLTVVYDDCYRSRDKTLLWTKIMMDLWTRKTKNKETISYFCHEAGNVYPQSATKKQWAALDEYSELLVHFRKRRIRAIYVSQLENEIYYRLREKCIYRIYRMAVPSNKSRAKKIIKYFKRQSIKHYHLFFGEIFRPLNSNPCLKETENEWFMIPHGFIDLKRESPGASSSSNFAAVTCEKCGASWLPKVARPKRCKECNGSMNYDITPKQEEVSA